MLVFISNGKKHVSAYSGHHQVLTTFLLKGFYITCLNRVVMLRSHHHLTCTSDDDDAYTHYWPKHLSRVGANFHFYWHRSTDLLIVLSQFRSNIVINKTSINALETLNDI
jgi:hypothetical protein